MPAPHANHDQIEPKRNRNKIVKIIFKTFLWIGSILIMLIIIIVIILQLPSTQRFLSQKTIEYLSKKIKSKIELGNIRIAFPQTIEISELYVEDLNKDTLLYGESLKININLSDLFAKRIILNKIDIQNLTAHIHRNNQDTNFNFSFIPDAFSSDNNPMEAGSAYEKSLWTFSIHKIVLTENYITYHDTLNGLNVDTKLGLFEAILDTFDLDRKIILIKSIRSERTSGSFVQKIPLRKTQEESSPFDYRIALESLHFRDFKFAYKSEIDHNSMHIGLGHLKVKIQSLDLVRQKIAIREFLLSESDVAYTQNKFVHGSIVGEKVIPLKKLKSGNKNGSDWNISLNVFDLKNNSFGYEDENSSPLKEGIDWHHLAIKNIHLKGEKLLYGDKGINISLKNLKLEERSGFLIKKFSTQFSYTDTHIELANLDLETAHSRIREHLSIKFRSLEEITKVPGNIQLDLNIKETHLAVSEALLFKPDLLDSIPFKLKDDEIIHLKTKLSGSIDDLEIEQLELSLLNSSFIKLQGNIKKMLEPRRTYLDIQVAELNSGRNDMASLLPDSLIPDQLILPERMNLKGHFRGYFKNFNSGIQARTSIGDFNADVLMNSDSGDSVPSYVAGLSTQKFDIGKLFSMQETLGPITMSAKIKGSGLDTSNINAAVHIAIAEAGIKGYQYTNFVLDGILRKKSFIGNASIDDKNLAFDLSGNLDLDPVNSIYKFKLDLKGADLKELHLLSEDIRIQALIESDMKGSSDGNIIGNVSIRNAFLNNGGKKYPVDSIILIARSENGISDIDFSSEVLTAHMKGTMNVWKFPSLITKHLNTYFEFSKQEKTETLKPAKVEFEIHILDPSLLSENFIPDLKRLSPSEIKGSFNSETKMGSLHLEMDQLIYADYKVDTLKFDLNSNPESLSYLLNSSEVSNPQIKVKNVFLEGDLANNTLSFHLNTSKRDSARMFDLGGALKKINDVLELRFNAELAMSNKQWTIDTENYLLFSKQGVYANKLILSNGIQQLSINSLGPDEFSPLEIKFTKFDISDISRIIENERELVKGTLDGNLTVKKENKIFAFTSEMDIQDLSILESKMGNVRLHANNDRDPRIYELKMELNGSGNEAEMNGTYAVANDPGILNFTLDIRKLSLASVEPFTMGKVSKMSGDLNGEIHISGNTTSPEFTGNLSFTEAKFKPAILNSFLRVDKAKINFDSKKINFNSLVLLDSLNNKATLNGYVDIRNLKEINADLDLKTGNFLVLNTTQRDNPLYFGRIYLDSDIRLKGTIDRPRIDMKAKLNRGTSLTYIESREVSKSESEGIVEFTDGKGIHNDIMSRVAEKEKNSSDIKGIELNAIIDFDKEAKFKLLVDNVSGDSLYVKGEGSLNFSLDPVGKTTLSGKYQVLEGGYDLTINDFIKKEFHIVKGSYVFWSGEIADPYVDLKAIYKVNTSPMDLLQNEISAMQEFQKNKYRNTIPFWVYLKMHGNITEPHFSFDIQLPPESKSTLNAAINAKLSDLRTDETQMNAQVFALLSLNRFIGEDPLENSNPASLSSASRSSASRVLSKGLGSLSAKYIKGVDLDVGLNSYDDYSSGKEEGRTQLQVGLSKKLWSDKLTVHVGGNVDLEGERAKQNNASEIAGNVNIEYMLSKNGRYRLKLYRENDYENPIVGELVKTGVGIIYTRDFNKLIELFSRNKVNEIP
jgi:translocation and assembly module TamB